MIEYIKGRLVEKTPSFVIIETNGIGYSINISLNTYSDIPDKENIKLLITEIIKEDSHTLYGFLSSEERDLFNLLISVSGVGPNTGRMMLSSLKPIEINTAIVNNDYSVLKGIKGIGEKTAQRIIIDLKGKLSKSITTSEFSLSVDNTIQKEALSALIMLGFSKAPAEKVIKSIVKTEEKDLTVEELIKFALNKL